MLAVASTISRAVGGCLSVGLPELIGDPGKVGSFHAKHLLQQGGAVAGVKVTYTESL